MEERQRTKVDNDASPDANLCSINDFFLRIAGIVRNIILFHASFFSTLEQHSSGNKSTSAIAKELSLVELLNLP